MSRKAAESKEKSIDREKPAYAAPALEKGLDILELLCRSESPLPQKEISQSLGRGISEIYRMITCLVERGYVANVGDKFVLTNKLFELAHQNPPTKRLLTEAAPIMQKVSSDLEQSCHLTVYNGGRQIVLYKVDSPTGMGFSVRVGAELDVIVSASGRVLLAFQDDETRRMRVEESTRRRPDHADPKLDDVLNKVRKRGFESIPSIQVRGLHAVSFPITDSRGYAIAAMTVPYAERIDDKSRASIKQIEQLLKTAAGTLSSRIGGVPAKPEAE